MNPISTVLKLHYRDKLLWFYIPAIILFSSFAINLIVSFLVTSQEDFYTGGLASIFTYLLVQGIIVVAKTFPFAVGMSIRRTDYYIGTAAMGVISSAVFTLLIFLLGQLENQLNGWGNKLHFFYFPYINDGTFLEQLSIYLFLFLNFFSLGFLISSFVKRFGSKGVFIASTAILLIGSIAVYVMHSFSLWPKVFSWFGGQSAVQLAYWLIPFIIVYLLVSFLLLRRTSV